MFFTMFLWFFVPLISLFCLFPRVLWKLLCVIFGPSLESGSERHVPLLFSLMSIPFTVGNFVLRWKECSLAAPAKLPKITTPQAAGSKSSSEKATTSVRFVSLQDAVSLIPSKSVVCAAGFAGTEACFGLYLALQARHQEEFVRCKEKNGHNNLRSFDDSKQSEQGLQLTLITVNVQGGRGRIPGTVEALAEGYHPPPWYRFLHPLSNYQSAELLRQQKEKSNQCSSSSSSCGNEPLLVKTLIAGHLESARAMVVASHVSNGERPVLHNVPLCTLALLVNAQAQPHLVSYGGDANGNTIEKAEAEWTTKAAERAVHCPDGSSVMFSQVGIGSFLDIQAGGPGTVVTNTPPVQFDHDKERNTDRINRHAEQDSRLFPRQRDSLAQPIVCMHPHSEQKHYWLKYSLPAITVALLNGHYADTQGNVFLDQNITITESIEAAMAVHMNCSNEREKPETGNILEEGERNIGNGETKTKRKNGCVLATVQYVVPFDADRLKAAEAFHVVLKAEFITAISVVNVPRLQDPIGVFPFFWPKCLSSCAALAPYKQPWRQFSNVDQVWLVLRLGNMVMGITPRRRRADIFLGQLAAFRVAQLYAGRQKNSSSLQRAGCTSNKPVTSLAEEFQRYFPAVDYKREKDAHGLSIAYVTIGTGLPEEALHQLWLHGIAESLPFCCESGTVGGLPCPGMFFGAALNPTAIESEASVALRLQRRSHSHDNQEHELLNVTTSSASSWAPTSRPPQYVVTPTSCPHFITVLGAAEVSRNGDVNVHVKGTRGTILDFIGVGGFCNFVHDAQHIIFVFSWWMPKVASRVVPENKSEEEREKTQKGGNDRQCKLVSHLPIWRRTFAAKSSLRRGQTVEYCTHVGRFRLKWKNSTCLSKTDEEEETELELVEVLPGVDVQRDVVQPAAHVGATISVAAALKTYVPFNEPTEFRRALFASL